MSFWIGWVVLLFLLLGFNYLRTQFVISRVYSDFFFWSTVTLAALMSGFRHQIGYDYDTYVEIYKKLEDSPIITYIEPGFSYTVYLLIKAGLSEQGIFFFFSILTIIPIALTLKRYSADPYLSLLIFLLNRAFFFDSMSIVRQFFAIALIFYAVRYIIDRKFWWYFLFVVVATLFHKTALITLPFYFFAHTRKLHNLLLFGGVLLVILFPPVNYLENSILLTDYEQYFDSKKVDFSSGTTLILRVLLFFWAMGMRHRFTSEPARVINMLYLLSFVIYFATLTTEAIARTALYVTVFETIALVNIFYEFVRRDRINIALVFISYTALTFFIALKNADAEHIRGTSMQNIYYSFDFKLFR